MRFTKFITTCSLAAVISSTTLPAYAEEHLLGTLIGGAAGAAIGSNVGKGKGNIAAIAVGTLVGAGIGNSLSGGRVYAANYDQGNGRGHGYGHQKHNKHYDNYHYQPYYGYTTTTYSSYEPYYYRPQVIEVNSYQQAEPEEYCREFSQGINIGGKIQPGYGIACLQPDGSWEIKKNY
jgi:surface antigen